MTKNIKDLNIETKEFIKKNNIFIDEFDVGWVGSGVNGISTFGKPNIKSNHKKIKGENSLTYSGEVMYEATYTFDKLGRRNTTHIEHNKTKKSIFFGDSILFGEGLNDNKTFPHYFEYFNPEYESFNYGFPGHGPGHMLLQIQSDEFKKEFKDKSGDVFFLFRDDAIKNACGKVNWNEGFPKYKILNNELHQVGFFKDEPGEDSYLPSEFTDDDFKITVEIFKKCKEELKKISNKLNFSVIIVPLSFSNFKLHPMLIRNNIDVCNLYNVDVESYLGDASRFLDGGPTKFMNKFLNQRMNYYKKMNISTEPLVPFDTFDSISELENRVKVHSFLMAPMNDFPADDAGVLIAMILEKYIGTKEVDEENLMKISEIYFNKKKECLRLLKNNKLSDIKDLFGEFDSLLYDMFEKEYIEYRKIYNRNEYIIDE